jgi:hypothetical protein
VQLDLATVLLQWATGGLLFLWVTTRHRLVGLGYGWLLRGTYLTLALAAFGAGISDSDDGGGAFVRDAASLAIAVAAGAALVVSVVRRSAGVSGQRARRAARRERVAAMTGAPQPAGASRAAAPGARDEFPPALDLIAPVVGLVGIVGAAAAAGGSYPLSLWRLVAGTLLMGAVTDAMLLGHWYLVQPGLSREPLRELVWCSILVWPLEVAAYLWPTGMFQVLTGTVDDGWSGLLGWTWVACAATTLGLAVLTLLALRERAYSAVMAATGLLYLAILTAFGTDLIARAVLAP